MQIHYCDGCGNRIDIDEGIADGDKIYCKACAATRDIPPPNPPGASGSNRGIAASGSGLRHTPGGSRPTGGSRRSPGLGTSRRSPGGGNPVQANPTPKAPAKSRTATVKQPRATDGNSDDTSESSDYANKPALIYGLLGLGLILAGAGIFLITKANNVQPPPIVKPEKAEKTIDAKQVDIGKLDPKPPVEPPRQDSAPIGILSNTGSNDREDYAQRELDRIHDMEKSGMNPGVLMKRYQSLATSSSSRGTKAGREAEESLKSLPGAVMRQPDNPGNTVPGVSAEYYPFDQNLEASFKKQPNGKTILKKIDVPSTKIAEYFGRQEWVAVRFTGYLEVPRDGTYILSVKSDDGSKLFIGDILWIDHDGSHESTEKSESVMLKAGKHQFRLDYYQGAGNGDVFFLWSGPGINHQIVPESALSH